nr:uncharacterized protein LOC128671702 [Plodia interpunctella]
MGMSAKEKSRRYREKLKADPQKYEERKRKKRESYHKNKRLVSDLQPEEKKICRTIWKLRKQNQRQRKKAIENILADTPPSSPIVLQEINVPQDYNNCECTPPASPSSRVSTPVSKERGRKKIRRDRTKMYKENLCLQHETEMWKKKYEKYKKRAHRKEKEIIKLREKKEKETEIERNKYKTLSNAIKEHYSLLKNRKQKLIIKNIFKNIDKKERHRIIGLQCRSRTKTTQQWDDIELPKIIRSFFCRDDVSRNTAGKKETVSKGKEKAQKRFLLDSMKNLFKAFKLENPKLKCSYFYFTKNRPYYVVKPTIGGREMCLCKIHTNIAAKIRALKQKRIIDAIDLSAVIAETVCDSNREDCMYGKCSECKGKKIRINENRVQSKIQWSEWIRDEEIYLKEGKTIKAIKNIKKHKEDTAQNLILSLEEDMKTVKKHVYNMKTQYRSFRQSVDAIKLNEAVVVVDFSENYNAKCTEEIQAHHFGGSRNQITLHTVVVYVHDKEKTYKALSFCSVSPCNVHQPAAIWAHLHPILTLIRQNYPEIDIIHFFSDGPFSQYRQKLNFFLACTKTFVYGFQYFTWSYFEAGHGKGPADGIGGYLKRAADTKVATGTDITNALEFYTVLKDSSKIKLFYITKEDIDFIQNSIPKNIVPLKGTKEVHQIFSRVYGQLKYRYLSCFCARGLCECLHPKVYLPLPDLIENSHSAEIHCSDDDMPLIALTSKAKERISIEDFQGLHHESVYKAIYDSSENSEEDRDFVQPGPSNSGQSSKLPIKGDFLLVKVHDTKRKSYHTYACIAQDDIEDDGEIRVTFLKCVKGGKLFVINENDISYVAYEDIVRKLPMPELQCKRDVNYYKFPFDVNVFEK